MTTFKNKNITTSSDYDLEIIIIPIDENLISFRCLNKKRTRFEIEYGLERGTSANSFLFLPNDSKRIATLIHPPGAAFSEIFIPALQEQIRSVNELRIVLGHINPNRIKLLKKLVLKDRNIKIVCSGPGEKLFKELWSQERTDKKNISINKIIDIPNIEVIRKEQVNVINNHYILRLIPTPTARWPGGLMAFEEQQGLLMSDKIFGAHLYSTNWAESNRNSTEEERRHYFDCLMAPMTSQINGLIDRFDELEIKTIAPGHGPAIENSWRSLFNDYRQWGEGNHQSLTKVILLFASAYGNTAAIADALANGISRTGVQVESLNCEFLSAIELSNAIKKADAYLIGTPTLGGHAPTPIVSALGTLLEEGNRQNPIGIFGSYGWSGEALDLLEQKLSDGGFSFGFNPIKIKFSPDLSTLKTIEETGILFGRKLLKLQRKKQRHITRDISSSKSDPSIIALGRIVGSLCVLTTEQQKQSELLNGAMVASWVSQASFSPPGISIAVAKDRALESLLHIGNHFVLNILADGEEKKQMKTFLKPFEPGTNRLSGLNLDLSPNNQPILKEAMAWLEGCVEQRMECGDHWLIYAKINHGKVLNANALTAVHHRQSGITY
tara:strand:+ start:3250 stop:5079 length:1830 start_codon:yes stop_codon:yes gene_type:complete